MTPITILLRYACAIVLFALLTAIGLIALVRPAGAQAPGDDGWIRQTLKQQRFEERRSSYLGAESAPRRCRHWSEDGECILTEAQARRRSRIDVVPVTKLEVRRYVPAHYERLDRGRGKQGWRRDWRDEDRDSEEPQCRRWESGLGRETRDPNEAQASAEANWIEVVKFKWGVRYTDLKVSKGARFVCARSGSGNRASEKAASAVAATVTTILPFARKWMGGDFLRQCQIWARPCLAEEIFLNEDKEQDKD